MKWLLRLAIVVVLGRAAAFAQTPPPPEVPKDFIAQMQAQIASAEAKVTDTTAYTPAAKPLALLCQSDRFFFLDEQPFTPAWTPPEVLKLHPSWVEINPDGAHVEFGGGFHHFGYDLKLDPAASTDTQNSWSLSFYSEDSPTKPLLTFLLNKTDHVERTQFISNALTEFKRRTGDPQIGDGSVAERLVFLLKFDATDLARASVRDCAAANPKDWMDQLLVYEMDFKNDRAASTRLDAWAHHFDDFSAWLLAAYAYDAAGDHDSAERSTKLALAKTVDEPDWLSTNARFRGTTICFQLFTAHRYATCAALGDALLAYNDGGTYLVPQLTNIRDLARQAAQGAANPPPAPPVLDDVFEPFKGIDLSRLAAAGPATTPSSSAPSGASAQPSATALNPDQARLLEYYDHRIAADPTSRDNHTTKIAYLLSLNRTFEALAACGAAAQAFPTWWRPRMALAELADANSRPQAESDFRKWAQDNPAFIHWWYLCRYYRDQNRDDDAIAALQLAVKYPLENIDRDEVMVPAGFAFDAASYAYRQRQYDLVLDIARIWSAPRGIYKYLDYDLYAFRAAAELALGQFPAAKSDADKVAQYGATHGLWASNLTQLQQAVDRQDQTYQYDPGSSTNTWSLFPTPQ